MAVVQELRIPNPERSISFDGDLAHGSDNTQRREVTGWIGRYFDAQCGGADPRKRAEMGTIGMNFGKVMPQSFRNSSNVGLSLDNPDTFLWNPSGETLGLAKAQEAIFARLNKPQSGAMATMKRSMEQLGGISSDQPGAIDFLKHTALNALVAGDNSRLLCQGEGCGELSPLRSRAATQDNRQPRRREFPHARLLRAPGWLRPPSRPGQLDERLLGDVPRASTHSTRICAARERGPKWCDCFQ